MFLWSSSCRRRFRFHTLSFVEKILSSFPFFCHEIKDFLLYNGLVFRKILWTFLNLRTKLIRFRIEKQGFPLRSLLFCRITTIYLQASAILSARFLFCLRIKDLCYWKIFKKERRKSFTRKYVSSAESRKENNGNKRIISIFWVTFNKTKSN